MDGMMLYARPTGAVFAVFTIRLVVPAPDAMLPRPRDCTLMPFCRRPCAWKYMHISASVLDPCKKKEKEFERWSDKGARYWSCEGKERYMNLTFVSRHKSVAAARVGCLLFPRHVPLCGIPAPWRVRHRVSKCFGYCRWACAARGRNADIMYGTVGRGR